MSESRGRVDKRNLTEGPVWQALSSLALPMILGIVAVMSIEIADTYFVGQLGTLPLAAISFTFPVTFSMTSLAIGLGAGTASLVSRSIGAGDREAAARLSTDALFLGLLLVLIISALGLWLNRPLYRLLGAEGEVLDMATDYMRIWFFSMPLLVVPMIANAIIRASGDAFWPSLIMVVSAVVNIAVTPVFVFGLGAIPRLEIEGAAWGTAVARLVTLALSLFIVIYREKLVVPSLPSPGQIKKSWGRVIKIGLPAAIGNATNPIGIAVTTAILAGFGAAVVAGFGTSVRIQSFSCIPMLALSASIGPLAGQNWGAGRKDRVIEGLTLSYKLAFAWSAILGLLFLLIAPAVVSLFTDDPTVKEEAVLYLRIIPFTLWGYGVTIVAAGAYNALGKATTGLGYYVIRTAVFYVPLSYGASLLAGSREVYVGIALANVLAGLVIGWLSLRWLSRHNPETG
ncbi:MATE efflux family protein [Parvularcula bermudensis HTCC2503]|uniref:MATE efflux family protein n=1 Tax=Parvularcula bermudensis (strain ATCC BAA-594 / HTCC2503 / KCTC 12087) TaxID=314260 RepID=E0TDA2_PARBH|nr:MATE family efflux transporter [Parvularcula bermudensis]ADM09925.1 MATE efflux family protein [Parvularcula bermudensis HTCC2503]